MDGRTGDRPAFRVAHQAGDRIALLERDLHPRGPEVGAEVDVALATRPAEGLDLQLVRPPGQARHLEPAVLLRSGIEPATGMHELVAARGCPDQEGQLERPR